MGREASLTPHGAGRAPEGEGWFVVNARDAAWVTGPFGAYTPFEGAERFARLGVNIARLGPGEPNCLYHGEDEQEDFLVLSGDCLAIVDEQERMLGAWDFVHCPPGTEHVFVGAGEHGCLLLGIGTRGGRSVVYPASEVAGRHGAAARERTDDPSVAYADAAPDVPVAFDPRWLPGDGPSAV